MAQNGSSALPPVPTSSADGANASGNGNASGAREVPGLNPELLRSMMECVDTTLFSPAQLSNWDQMKARLQTAAEQHTPVAMTGSDLTMVKTELARTSGLSGAASATADANSTDFRQPLHREASIQDVLACLLEQQPPSGRMPTSSSGGGFLVKSEASRQQQQQMETKPSLKKLLSSNDFTMTEKKESLRHLLSFIDNSFASNTPEPLTQVYKDCENGSLQRLSSLQLMRSFMSTPTTAANTAANANATANTSASTPQQQQAGQQQQQQQQQQQTGQMQQNMGTRTTSFEIIQAMLNATSNQAIQKPMTSQDSFRFQHLARTLESIETDVAYDNEDYGGDDVVQVDNLDNLLDYHGGATSSGNAAASTGPASSSTSPPAPVSSAPVATASTGLQSGAMAPNGMNNAGFVDTQTLLNPSRSIYNELGGPLPGTGGNPNGGAASFQTFSQALDGHHGPGMYTQTGANLPTMGLMNQQSLNYQQQQQQLLQQQLMRQEQQQKQQQQQYNQLYQSGLLPPQPQQLMGYGSHTPTQYAGMLMQQQAGLLGVQQKHPAQQLRGQQMRIPTQPGKGGTKVDAQGNQLCSALGCSHPARVKGMCKQHGGGRRCKVEGCMKSAQTGHLCIAHGGGKPCNVEGCPKTAQSRGLCKQHGGGVRCKFEGCTKSCQSGGFCRGHGGGKRCEYPNCTKWAQKNGHCAKHAQEIAARQLQEQQAQMQQLVHP